MLLLLYYYYIQYLLSSEWKITLTYFLGNITLYNSFLPFSLEHSVSQCCLIFVYGKYKKFGALYSRHLLGEVTANNQAVWLMVFTLSVIRYCQNLIEFP